MAAATCRLYENPAEFAHFAENAKRVARELSRERQAQAMIEICDWA